MRRFALVGGLLAVVVMVGCGSPKGDGDETVACEKQLESNCNGGDDDGDGVADDGCDCDYKDRAEGVCADSVVGCDGTCRKPAAWEKQEVTCDGKDNDCDGTVDEGFADVGEPCDSGDDDQCKNGTYECSADGTEVVCGEESKTDIEEVCDSRDNDCDGDTDEGCSCNYKGKSKGVCKVQTGGMSTGSCPEPPDYQTNETLCDGKDNDCDGYTDGVHMGCPAQVKVVESAELDIGYDVAVDDQGRRYLAGLRGDPQSMAGRAGYWARYAASGEQLALRKFDTIEADNVYSMAIDSQGNVLLAGETWGDIAGQENAGGDSEDGDMFVAKYDASGDREWVELIGSPAGDEGQAVGVDAQDNVYLVGETHGSIGGPNGGGVDWIAAKFGPDGDQQWLEQFGTRGDQNVDELFVASDGTLYSVGDTDGDISGETNAGNTDLFVVQLDPNGIPGWTRLIGTSDYEFGSAIEGDGDGSLYVAGEAEGDIDGARNSGGGGDAMLVKLSTSGQTQWTRLVGSSDIDYGRAVDVGPGGHIYMVGESQGELDGIDNTGSGDGFAVSFDSSGTRRWLTMWGTTAEDIFRGVEAISEGRIVVAGETAGDPAGNDTGDDYDGFISW